MWGNHKREEITRGMTERSCRQIELIAASGELLFPCWILGFGELNQREDRREEYVDLTCGGNEAWEDEHDGLSHQVRVR